MAVTHRIKRLERAMRVGDYPAPPCAKCGGAGHPGLTVVREPAATGAVRGGCNACGKVSSVIKYILPLSPGEAPASDPWEIV